MIILFQNWPENYKWTINYKKAKYNADKKLFFEFEELFKHLNLTNRQKAKRMGISEVCYYYFKKKYMEES